MLRPATIPAPRAQGAAGQLPLAREDATSPGLYVHVPFCHSRCTYCDFHTTGYREARAERYLSALTREADAVAQSGFTPVTIFIGGGTPSALSPRLFDRLLAVIEERFRTAALREWTVEANPGSLTAEKAEIAVRHGVDRASTGAQSFQREGLAILGRRHSAADVFESHRLLRDAGIRRCNVDLILGWPGQTDAALAADFRMLARLRPEHVSVYHLTYEEGTWLTRMRDRRLLRVESDETLIALGRAALVALECSGYTRYEVSNFAMPGEESLHNLNYWRRGVYRGIGSGAASFDGVRRWVNRPDVDAYIEGTARDSIPRSVDEELGIGEAAAELLLLGLRLREGLPDARFLAAVGCSLAECAGSKLRELARGGFLEWDSGVVRATARGYEVLDSVVLALVEEVETWFQSGSEPTR
ncbi:MAG: radical SAM family heme chaperone HemW [Planctomycetes bacterium]|nr:radical SAM family heme chaperone HemW [Planctomycetota bacterium]